MIKIEYLDVPSSVYDITVEDNHNFFANNILVHNCIEIFEVSTPKEQAVCNLGSIAVCMYYTPGVGMDYQSLYDDAYLLTLSLNKVIDVNYYPTPETKLSNMRHRPIAIGLQGLADLFAMAKAAFESPEAAELNKLIYETMAFASITASKDLAKKEGAYETFQGSPLSQGIFQFDMWEDVTVKPIKGKLNITDRQPIKVSGLWDWDNLRKEVMEHGVRNSLNISQMPTASCQTVDTEIITSVGAKSYREILTENGIDVEAKESGIEQHWITLETPVTVQTMNGFVETNQIFYNGHHEVFELEMEDGAVFEATANHKFLVNRESGQTWVRVDGLQETDDIVNIFKSQMKIKDIKAGGYKPTWDIQVPGEEHYIMKNGCVSHNTSSILGNNESNEPFTSNIYARKVLSGEFMMVNKHLIQDLISVGLWNDDMRQLIISYKGSVQSIEVIPEDIRNRYKTVWEMKQRPLLDMAAERGAFICQSQSMNLFIPNDEKMNQTLTTALMYGWKKGLKTLSYYIRTKAALSANSGLGLDQSKIAEIKSRLSVKSTNTIKASTDIEVFSDAEKLACSINSLESGDDCLACGS